VPVEIKKKGKSIAELLQQSSGARPSTLQRVRGLERFIRGFGNRQTMRVEVKLKGCKSGPSSIWSTATFSSI
jgi:hypothetical protein